MSARPPSEHEPQPVPGHQGWFWWQGVNGMLYARQPGSHPPRLARAHNWIALLGRIRKAEESGPGGARTP